MLIVIQVIGSHVSRKNFLDCSETSELLNPNSQNFILKLKNARKFGFSSYLTISEPTSCEFFNEKSPATDSLLDNTDECLLLTEGRS